MAPLTFLAALQTPPRAIGDELGVNDTTRLVTNVVERVLCTQIRGFYPAGSTIERGSSSGEGSRKATCATFTIFTRIQSTSCGGTLLTKPRGLNPTLLPKFGSSVSIQTGPVAPVTCSCAHVPPRNTPPRRLPYLCRPSIRVHPSNFFHSAPI